jgi:DNA-binding NarL/FixJ family response regulator
MGRAVSAGQSVKKVLLVDDHAFLRDALAEVMLRYFPRAQVLQVGTLQAARCLLGEHADLDLVLLDLSLPDGDGLQALPALRQSTAAWIVVMSADERIETVNAALDAGAAGYLPKTLGGDEMLAAVRRVLDGGVYVPALAIGANPALASLRSEPMLSPRQREVLALLVAGAANKVIARELDIGEATVKSHVAAIFEEFGVTSRTQVVVEFARRGLRIDPHSWRKD